MANSASFVKSTSHILDKLAESLLQLSSLTHLLKLNIKKELRKISSKNYQLEFNSLVVGEPKSRIRQKHTFFAPERYTTRILYTDSLNGA